MALKRKVREDKSLVNRFVFIVLGPFAEAQANFLRPDPIVVQELDNLVERKKVGIVAHFYMDPELQVL